MSAAAESASPPSDPIQHAITYGAQTLDHPAVSDAPVSPNPSSPSTPCFTRGGTLTPASALAGQLPQPSNSNTNSSLSATATSSGGACALYVGDLPHNITEEELTQHFSTIAPVRSVRVCREFVNNLHNTYAYVNYNTPDDGE